MTDPSRLWCSYRQEENCLLRKYYDKNSLTAGWHVTSSSSTHLQMKTGQLLVHAHLQCGTALLYCVVANSQRNNAISLTPCNPRIHNSDLNSLIHKLAPIPDNSSTRHDIPRFLWAFPRSQQPATDP